MYSFNCLIKTDASLVKGSLSESHGETELLANLYGKIICIEDDANGMSPTETVPTPVDVFDIILGYREASELISFAEDMKKRALHAALETARYALKKWDKDGISIQSSLEKCFCTIPMGSTEAYNLSCATDILSNHPCSEACELFYNGIEWKCYPDDTELNDVIAHPEQYIVIPVLFSDKSIYDDSKIEAHSAITPTGKWPASLTGTQKTVFDCILNRFCAVFCEEACTVDRTTIVIHSYDEDFTLKGDVQVTPGWRKFEKPTSGDKLLPKLNKGDAVNINFKTVGKMTTPPKRYTVESLNNWMVAPMRGAEKANEEYSDEEWKEILSDATICTEATRADTVDRCVKSNYISLKKGVYYGEAEGFRLVDTMEKLGINLDVPVTVNLSKQLHSIKDGTLTRIDVLEFTKKTIEEIMAKNVAIESAQTRHGNLPVICKCPRCGNDVVETQKTFSCIGKDKDGNRCPVTLWKKNKFFESIGKKLTKTTAAALLTKGKVPLKGCVSKKTGKKYDCILTCDCSKGRPEFHLEFDHSGASGTVLGKCPFCGSDVAEGSKGYSCTNKDCSAVLWKNSKLYGNDVKISATAAKALLANKAVSAKIKNKDKTADVNVKVGIEPHEMPNGKKYINLKVLSYEK